MDKIPIIIIAVVVLAGAIFWAFQSGVFSGPVTATQLPSGIVLFYGEECPHCKDVEEFIANNKIEDKVKISRMEVWHNKNNQAALTGVVQKCGITGSSIGVPFLYDGNGKCYVGEIDVPNFLKTQAGIQ